MSYEEHREAARLTPVRCAVLTVSDTRDEDSDRSGSLIRVRLERTGHQVAFYRIIPDDAAVIRKAIQGLAGRVEVVLINGGTGFGARDRTVDVAEVLFEQRMPGFGELFRMLSFQEIGAGAMLSRATAGLYKGTLYFCLPGSTQGVQLGLDKLILPELRHLVWEVIRQQAPST
ncbi:MAG: molybdenum cofactor biosynthesis protein B [Bacteroidota bacterium]